MGFDVKGEADKRGGLPFVRGLQSGSRIRNFVELDERHTKRIASTPRERGLASMSNKPGEGIGRSAKCGPAFSLPRSGESSDARLGERKEIIMKMKMFVSARYVDTGLTIAFEADVTFSAEGFATVPLPNAPHMFAEINLSDPKPEWRIFPN